MKYWIIVAFAAVAALVLSGCEGGTTPPEQGWTYVGTWVNSLNNGHGGAPPGKIVATTDSLAAYDNDTSPIPVQTDPFSLADDWTSGGDHYFKGMSMATYALIRVSNNNNTLEVNSSSTAYPTSVTGQPESIFIRQ